MTPGKNRWRCSYMGEKFYSENTTSRNSQPNEFKRQFRRLCESPGIGFHNSPRAEISICMARRCIFAFGRTLSATGVHIWTKRRIMQSRENGNSRFSLLLNSNAHLSLSHLVSLALCVCAGITSILKRISFVSRQGILCREDNGPAWP